MSKTKRKFILWALLGALFAIIACFSVCVAKPFSVKADESAIATDINKIESWDNGTSMIFYLSESDYMTASEWSTESNEAYKWVKENCKEGIPGPETAAQVSPFPEKYYSYICE